MAAFLPYPYQLLPRSRRRRHGVFFYVWLGSHPVLLIISAVICLYLWAFLLAWVAAVTLGWLLCGLVSLPFRAARG